MRKSINHRTFSLNRRSFLRSTTSSVSTVVALPLLEAMFASDKAYAVSPWEYPRFFTLYVPNGIIEEKWFPESGNRENFDLSGTALAAFQEKGLKNEISLYRGMSNACLTESSGNPHLIGMASWLTGKGITDDETKTHRMSVDQELADFLPRTRVHSLQLAGNPELDVPNNNRYFNPLKNALNWTKNGRFLPWKSNLRAEFDKLYSDASTTPGTEIDRRTHMQISVLDDIKEDQSELRKRLGAADAQRLDEYFESLRELEIKLEELSQGDPQNPLNCTAPLNRNDVPDSPNNKRNDSIGEHMKVAAKIVAHAFACGLTHSITYAAGGETAGCRYNDIGLDDHYHDAISHNRAARYNDWVKVDRFHGDHAAIFMEEMKNTKFGPGDVLDNAVFLFGSCMGNGDSHSHRNIPLLAGGRIGGWQHGRYHRLNNENHGRLINTFRSKLGIPTLSKDRYPDVPTS